MDDWQDILKQDRRAEEAPSLPTGAETSGRSSLMQQIRELVGQTGAPVPTEAEDAIRTEERTCCPDGYVRRSPVQPYVTPPDYRRRMIRKCILFAVLAAFAVLLVIALLKSKLLSFR
jgi:hypothetical protein